MPENTTMVEPRPGASYTASILAMWIIGTLAVVVPFWIAVIPPMTDVSQHVLVARIILKYEDRAYRFSEYFEIAWNGSSTELFYRLLSALQSVLGPYTDSKVYLCIFVIVLSISAWVLARVQRVEAPWLASLVILPLGSCWYVYMGFLPFVMTLPLFALTVAVWLSELRCSLKIVLLWCLLLLLYGFHIVGAAAAATVIAASAILSTIRSPKTLEPLLAAAAGSAPLVGVTVAYLSGTHQPMVTPQYGGIIDNLIHTVAYTCSSLAESGRFLMLLWLAGIGAATLWQWSKQLPPAWVMTSGCLLVALSIFLPTSLGALWPAGPRLFPFALILLVTGLSCPHRHVRRVGLAAVILVLALNIANGIKTRELDREFRHFISATPLVTPGARLLPILIDPTEGAKAVSPFWSLPAAYTIYRGGVNPYIFATPYIRTGASPLRYRRRDDFGYSFLYDRARTARDYGGVGKMYDYVLMWGAAHDVDAVLEKELTILYQGGKLKLYGSVRR